MGKRNGAKELPDITLFQIEEELLRRKSVAGTLKVFFSVLGSFIVVSAVAILIATLWLPVMQVHGTSMEPILSDGQIVVAIRGERHIKRGDLVAFYYNNQVLLKRAIGLPGDVINIDKNGNVYINGKLQNEPYIEKKSLGICNIDLPVTVDDNSLFVMGDKRAVSVDSRSKDIGMIYGERTIGKIVFRVWNLRSFGFVK